MTKMISLSDYRAVGRARWRVRLSQAIRRFLHRVGLDL